MLEGSVRSLTRRLITVANPLRPDEPITFPTGDPAAADNTSPAGGNAGGHAEVGTCDCLWCRVKQMVVIAVKRRGSSVENEVFCFKHFHGCVSMWYLFFCLRGGGDARPHMCAWCALGKWPVTWKACSRWTTVPSWPLTTRSQKRRTLASTFKSWELTGVPNG